MVAYAAGDIGITASANSVTSPAFAGGGTDTVLLCGAASQNTAGFNDHGTHTWDVGTPENFVAISGCLNLFGSDYWQIDLLSIDDATSATDTVTANFDDVVDGCMVIGANYTGADTTSDGTFVESGTSPLNVTVSNIATGDFAVGFYVGGEPSAPTEESGTVEREVVDDVGDGYTSGAWGDRESNGTIGWSNGSPTYDHSIAACRIVNLASASPLPIIHKRQQTYLRM